MTIEGACESLLFVAGEEGLSLEELANLLDLSKEKVQYSLWSLDKQLKTDSQRGLELVCLGGRYQLLTQKIYADLIQKYAVSPFALKLSQQALETLAVIAYQGPITRLEIDEIRGVQSQAMIKRLLLHDLIEEAGRKEGPGRPILYQVTNYFYQYFGLNSIADLPDISSLLPEDEEDKGLFDEEGDK